MKKIALSLLFLFAGSLLYAQAIPPTNRNLSLTTSALPLANITAQSCSLQAPATNGGIIYVGGPTVTNAGGANPGIALVAGASIGNISVTNARAIYVVAASVGDTVTYICN